MSKATTITIAFIAGLQSLWLTTWCSSELQQQQHYRNHKNECTIIDKRQISLKKKLQQQENEHFHQHQQQKQPSGSQSSEKLLLTPASDTEMDDMLFQCNKNAIYVLNSSYKYGEFDMINLFGSPAGRALNNKTQQHQQPQTKNNNFNFNQNQYVAVNSIGGPIVIDSRVPPPQSLLNTTQQTLTALQQSSTNTLISSSSASLSTTTVATNSSTLGTNSLSQQHQQHIDLSPTSRNKKKLNLCTGAATSTTVTTAQHLTTSTTSNNKKTNILKGNLFAKKTKFWKFLEDEKNKKNSVEDLSTTSSTSGGQSSSSSRWRRSSNNSNNNNSNNLANNNNNKIKSSSELYREAAQLLGLSCTLSDNCRCLDCQSRYFDCDDSDSCSDNSFMAEINAAVEIDCYQNHYHQQQQYQQKQQQKQQQLPQQQLQQQPNKRNKIKTNRNHNRKSNMTNITNDKCLQVNGICNQENIIVDNNVNDDDGGDDDNDADDDDYISNSESLSDLSIDDDANCIADCNRIINNLQQDNNINEKLYECDEIMA